MTDPDALAEVLATHFLIAKASFLRGDDFRARCSCGWTGERLGQAALGEHRAHVAKALLASNALHDHIRGEREEAWAEGYGDGAAREAIAWDRGWTDRDDHDPNGCVATPTRR